MRFWPPFLILLLLSFAAAASTDIVGKIGKSSGFTGRFPIAGGIGKGGSGGACTGAIDTSKGCPLPILGS